MKGMCPVCSPERQGQMTERGLEKRHNEREVFLWVGPSPSGVPVASLDPLEADYHPELSNRLANASSLIKNISGIRLDLQVKKQLALTR